MLSYGAGSLPLVDQIDWETVRRQRGEIVDMKELYIEDRWAGWRWTHGFAEDVAEAVVLAATKTSGVGRIYNLVPSCRSWRNSSAGLKPGAG